MSADAPAFETTPRALSGLGVVLVAAGSGQRLGAGIPKALTTLGGTTLLEHAVARITRIPEGGHLVVVGPAGHARRVLDLLERAAAGGHWSLSLIDGGAERHDSVRAGLDALPEGIDVVLVHDAARALTPVDVFERVAAEVRRTGQGVIPGLPVVDTLKRVDDAGQVRGDVARAELLAAQTPQGFPRELLRAGHDRVAGLPTDDAAVVQAIGAQVRTVRGDPLAHKVTTPWDVRLLELLLADGAGGSAAAPAATPPHRKGPRA
ncbi:2-C-methyl-D-erythritol 4-phosphate cytidylyltransferase [Leucobacter sp. M11]|nr:2-C-methyl-D-erythritol 4-phosphate cytidylyltransferase [Leucobacter sp. M11]MEB4613960.1 2-C-methyl-D-erythritol 4-phosphate cytidylyltransferase [Leucobacter sp. M11]